MEQPGRAARISGSARWSGDSPQPAKQLARADLAIPIVEQCRLVQTDPIADHTQIDGRQPAGHHLGYGPDGNRGGVIRIDPRPVRLADLDPRIMPSIAALGYP